MALDLQELRRFVDVVLQSNPGDHFTTLGIAVEAVEHHHVQMSMPYRESLIGDPDTGVLHGGAITALLDTCCGFAAATALDDLGMTPTIDLRIDYMRAATPGKSVIADAEVYGVSESGIFTRALAHHGDVQHPIASAVGNFFRMESALFEEMRREFRRAEATEGGA